MAGIVDGDYVIVYGISIIPMPRMGHVPFFHLLIVGFRRAATCSMV